MIQRIQSVWLFLAAMINGMLLLPSMVLYHYKIAILEFSLAGDNYFPLVVVAAVMTLLPLITIFLFKDRKRQRGLCWLSIIACIGFLALLLMKVANIRNAIPPPTQDSYGIPGVLLPVAAVVFLFMALSGIRKDQKLVKSMDRLR